MVIQSGNTIQQNIDIYELSCYIWWKIKQFNRIAP